MVYCLKRNIEFLIIDLQNIDSSSCIYTHLLSCKGNIHSTFTLNTKKEITQYNFDEPRILDDLAKNNWIIIDMNLALREIRSRVHNHFEFLLSCLTEEKDKIWSQYADFIRIYDNL